MREVITVTDENEYRAAGELFREYAAWLNIDLTFQHFDEELLGLKEMYAQPYGTIILAKENELYAGCVAVRKQTEEVAELKRMYTRPAFRKTGLGALLLAEALHFAKRAGYKKIRLDTLSHMTPAIELYTKAGFYLTAPYYFNPEKNALFFEKVL